MKKDKIEDYILQAETFMIGAGAHYKFYGLGSKEQEAFLLEMVLRRGKIFTK